jgi:hypothetical protein
VSRLQAANTLNKQLSDQVAVLSDTVQSMQATIASLEKVLLQKDGAPVKPGIRPDLYPKKQKTIPKQTGSSAKAKACKNSSVERG